MSILLRSEIANLNMQQLIEESFALTHDRTTEDLNPRRKGDKQPLAGQTGSYSTLKNLQKNLKERFGKKDINEKDHVETQEWRSIFLQVFFDTVSPGESVLIARFLNNMRTSFKVCTRYGTYAEVGSHEESRCKIFVATLFNDPFKFSVTNHYTLESAKRIMRKLFVQHRLQVLTAIQQNDDWKCVPKHISAPFYEFTIGLLRFGKNFLKQSYIADPI
jgi:hypothetical protein